MTGCDSSSAMPARAGCATKPDISSELQQGPVLVWRAEQLAERVRPLEDQVSVVLPGDRDSAVELDGLAGDGRQRVGAVGLRDVGELRGVGGAGRDGVRRRPGGRA